MNAGVLRWARESQGYSVEAVAAHLGRDPSEIEAWERGDTAPTYAQLERLAYKLFKRPLAVFFLPSPPVEPNLKQEFRTLPEFEIDQLSADTRYQLRLARAFQISLGELNDGANPAERKVFLEVQVTISSDPREAASTLREFFGISLATQRAWSSTEEALKNWRNAVESAGVFVFKNSFKQRDISGFSLADDEFPVIYLNNGTTKSRQVFSLFHELSHVLLGTDSISKVDESSIDHLADAEKHVERFCNALAAEFLIPVEDFSRQLESAAAIDDDLVVRLAERYHVSRESVLRRLLDLDLVTQGDYQRKAKQWAEEAEGAAGGSGGNYYATQATYLGDNYVRLVFAKHYQGKISNEQVADYLGVKTKSVAGLESLVMGRSVPA